MITFSYRGKTYELGFNRKTAALCESRGLKISELQDMPHSNIPVLVWGAFQLNHRGTPQDTCMEVFEHIPNKEKSAFIGKLVEEYAKTYTDIFGGEDNDGDKENLIEWKAE